MLTMEKKYTRKLTIAFVVCYLSISVVWSFPQQSNKRPLSNPTLPNPKKPSTGNRRMTDPAFVNAGQNPGLEIWRIEDFKPVPYPKSEYGKFYSGDSYVVLFTKVDKSGAKSWNIHFWLGKQTTQDEAGSAAIFAVQLDEHLGGAPIQYRETQEHESQLFLSYFKNGVRYAPGGVSSGFHHVDRNAFTKHLYEVKGSRNVRVKEVDVSISSMNKGDCFILDAGQTVYVYVGSKSRRLERIKAIAAANQIRDQDHAGKAKVIIVDEYSPESDYEEFFNALGEGDRNKVPDESTGGDDQKFEQEQENIVSLYKISDDSGSLKVDLIGQKPLQQSQLNSKDCYILDSTDSNIFVWIGKKCSAREKSEAMSKAEQFLKTKNYPSWTHVQRVVEGAEPTAFTQYFQTWKGYGELRTRIHRSIQNEEHDGFEPRLFHAQIRSKGGHFKVEEVFDYDQKDLNEDDIMLLDVGNEIFVWVGSGASDEEKEGAKHLAKKYLKKQHRDEKVTVKVINQGEEPEEFTSLFESWNPDLWETLTSYSDVKERVKAANDSLDI